MVDRRWSAGRRRSLLFPAARAAAVALLAHTALLGGASARPPRRTASFSRFDRSVQLASCSQQLDADCKPWESSLACLRCAQKHEADLRSAGCTVPDVQSLCKGSGPGGRSVSKVLLSGSALDNGGRCLDGSPAGFYFQPAAAEAPADLASTWVIYMQGGGDCNSRDSCVQRSKTYLGSSKNWPETMTCDLCDTSPANNPDFALVNSVYIPYCSGDVHSGLRTAATNDTFSLFFSGHLNVARIMDLLVSDYGIRNASRVLVTGGSAGGIGTFVNVDYVQQRLPNAVVKGAPNAGWFFPGDPETLPRGCGFPVDYDDWAAGKPTPWDNSTDVLWETYFLPSCVNSTLSAGKPEWYCGSIGNLYPHVKAPLLVLENQYDTNQIYAQLGAPQNPASPSDKAKADAYIARYGALMRNSTAQVAAARASGLKPGDGIFLPSCLEHGVANSTLIKNVSWMAVVGDWFFERNTINPIVVDDCEMTDGLPCNPTCKTTPS